ncbi:unnamed protein product [Acidithrix sp. C25]|nr:unnamed protein product [Acidithrix sp. C25]
MDDAMEPRLFSSQKGGIFVESALVLNRFRPYLLFARV